MNSKPLLDAGDDPPGFAAVIALAEQTPVEALPELVGRLAQAQALAALRLATATRQTERVENSLLTVEEVAGLLRISEANVYARAKTDLRGAAVDVGAGQLRFDRARVHRFIDARRRG